MKRLTTCVLLALVVAAISARPAGAQTSGPCCTVTLHVTVPGGTGTVYLAGSLPQLGPWRADGQALEGSGRARTGQVTVSPGTAFEYKFTLGTWDREALTATGVVPPNHHLIVRRDTAVTHEIAGFKKDQKEYIADWRGSGVKGQLVYWTDVPSRFLGPTRNVEVWLPPGYDTDPTRRYPVLYMHDGQNLFDPRIANTGTDWGVDEAITRLVEQGTIPPVIVVGAWNTSERLREYSPWDGAPGYARFLVEELMPRVNREFRTLTGPGHTGVMGSSLGGLLSFYLVTRHPDVFGACGCESTSFQLSEAVIARFLPTAVSSSQPDTTPYIIRDIANGFQAPPGIRMRFDYGSLEDSSFTPAHQAVRRWLLGQGLVEGRDFVVRQYAGARHNEASWRARLEDPLRFMFGAPGRDVNLDVPAWSKDAIWYQIFAERFRNGDTSNDPTAHDIQGFSGDSVPPGWAVTPWSHDWYALDPWARQAGMDFNGEIQFRRYGGDLQGVLDKLDYLQRLGVTALYFNPLNDAPSLHKYDARNYRHIDRNFGPDPRGDEAQMAVEQPDDPATWGWTAADSMFLAVVQEAHRRGMKVILDYSWNHTGIMFWAWQNILDRQAASLYANWYMVERFDDPATPDTNEFAYRGWAGVPWLPELKKIGRPDGLTKGPIPGNLVPAVKQLIFDVSRRWLDPDGNGDPSDGIDGFRLDVAEMVPLGFWRDYRRFVRSINPEAYLVGEIWWDQWPDTYYDPSPWLQGDVFDAVMNYRWYLPTRGFFARTHPSLTATQYAARLDALGAGIDSASQRAMMNLTASHDTPRFSTSIYNPGRYKVHNRAWEDSTYRIDRPDGRTREIQRMILAQQFTWIGAPHIWNGDEVGMWGADDPDERKPMVWADLSYENERMDPLGRPRRPDRVAPDTALYNTYRTLIALRKANLPLFVNGSVSWLLTDDARNLLVYARQLDGRRAIVAFNASDSPQDITVKAGGRFRMVFPAGAVTSTQGGQLRARLPARSARVWINE